MLAIYNHQGRKAENLAHLSSKHLLNPLLVHTRIFLSLSLYHTHTRFSVFLYRGWTHRDEKDIENAKDSIETIMREAENISIFLIHIYVTLEPVGRILKA